VRVILALAGIASSCMVEEGGMCVILALAGIALLWSCVGMCTTLILALEVYMYDYSCIHGVLIIQGVCGSHYIAMFVLSLCSVTLCARVERAGTLR
jgi:hypothetical protein